MELIYITLAVYGMGAATALFPKKMEMAAHYCAVLAAVFGSGALLYQSAASDAGKWEPAERQLGIFYFQC